jgi:Tol biopolymer transport system component
MFARPKGLHRNQIRRALDLLEDRAVPATVVNLATTGATGTANGALLYQGDNAPAGSAAPQTFVRLQGGSIEQGYNTDGRPVQFDEDTNSLYNHSLALNQVPVVTVNGVAYREFLLGITEQAPLLDLGALLGSPASLLSLDQLRIYVGSSGNLTGYNGSTRTLAGLSPVFDLDAAGDVTVKLNDRLVSSAGAPDARILIPDAAFAGQPGGGFVYLYSHFGGTWAANPGYEEWAVRPVPPPPPPPPPPPVPSTVVEQVTNGSDTSWFADSPAMSADGTHIAFLSNLDLAGQNADGNTEVFLYSTTTGVFTQVTNTTGFNFTGAPAISGDGGWVAFTTTANLAGANADGNAEVFRYNTATGSLTQVTDTTGGSFFANQTPSLSGDGSRMAFTSTRDLVPTVGNADGNAELFLWNSGTGTFTQATNTTGGNSTAVLGPAIDANGNRVAFLSTRDLVPGQNADGSSDYFLYDVGNGSFTQLTAIPAPGGIFTLPKVDADGSRVVFSTTLDLTGGNTDGSEEVFLWDSATGLTQVTNTVDFDSVASAISADGTRIAMSSTADLTGTGKNADGNQEVFLYNTATGKMTQLTDTAGTDPTAVWSDAPAMSADGTQFALLSTADLTGTGKNADGSTELFLETVNNG